MADKNPKLELKTNIPTDLKLIKNFWKGENEFGKSWGYDVAVGAVHYSWFVKEKLQQKLEGIPMGTVVRVVKEEKRSETDPTKTYHEYSVTTPLFDQKGTATPEPPPPAGNPLSEEVPMDEYRVGYRNALGTALVDVREIVRHYNSTLEEMETGLLMDHNDVRTLAQTFVIDLLKKR
jgi:hypothetical protein